MKKLLFLLFFLPLVSFGQDYGNNADAMKLCSVFQTNNFGTDVEAERGLDRILSAIGASKRFVLLPCDNINNAVATSYKGIRYILYDREFMNSISNSNNWANLFILAHEVGHHINGHSVDLVLQIGEVVEPKALSVKRQQELEADEFAGFVLSKLGGPISEANKIISRISTNSDDSYSTHPSRSKRLAAAKKGYNNALGLNNSKTNYYTLFKEGMNMYNISSIDKRKEALKIFDLVIDLKPNFLDAYFFAFMSSMSLEDYYRAISYLNKMIKLSPNESLYYTYRGRVFYNNLEEVNKAKADFESALSINDKDKEAMFYLGGIYGNSGNMNLACKYLSSSCNLGYKESCGLLKFCNE